VNVFSACAKGVFLFFIASFSWAAENSSSETVAPLAIDPMASAGKVIVFLVLIVGLIVLMAWLAGKSKTLQLGRSSGQIKTLAVLPLGIKEKVAVVQIGDKQLVLGITPQQINCLTELETPLTEPQKEMDSPGFSDLLKKALRNDS